jgi:FkbM family methyltransferase
MDVTRLRATLARLPPVQWVGVMRGLVRAAPSPADATRNALTFAVMPLLRPLLQRGRRQVVVRVAVDGATHDFHVDSLGDLRALYEVWALREYDVPSLAFAETIIDAGANIGASVAFFKARRPRSTVEAYEPDPANFRKLVRNVGGLPGVTLHRAAISDADGEAVLYSTKQGWDSSLVAGAGKPVRVPCRGLASARRDAGFDRVDLVKLDIEGGEFAVLADPAALDGIGAVVAELHFDLVPDVTLRDVLESCDAFRVTVTNDSSTHATLLAEAEAAAIEKRASQPRSPSTLGTRRR